MDVGMQNDRLFHAISKHLKLEQHEDASDSAPELWLCDGGSVKKEFIPARQWMIHKEKEVVFDKVFEGVVKRKVLKKKMGDQDHECFVLIGSFSF